MFSELPKLFDRDYTFGYFFPALAFVVANVALKDALGWLPNYLPHILISSDLFALNLTVIGFATFFVSLVISVLNYQITRLMEGYGNYNPLKIFIRREKKRFGDAQAKLSEANKEWRKNSDPEVRSRINETRMTQTRVLANEFPSKGSLILPTAFGNAIRAFEMYSLEMYGVEATIIWNRLEGVIPSEFKKQVSASKALCDLWMNLWFLSILLSIELLIAFPFVRTLPIFFALAFALFFAVLSSSFAKSAALGWGEGVKSCFDNYLPALLTQMGFAVPETFADERQLWTQISLAILQRKPFPMRGRDGIQRVPVVTTTPIATVIAGQVPPATVAEVEETKAISVVEKKPEPVQEIDTPKYTISQDEPQVVQVGTA